MSLSKEQVTAFLADLTELTRKHGVVIGGCGCCSSPWMSELADSEREKEYTCAAKERDLNKGVFIEYCDLTLGPQSGWDDE